MILVIGQGDVQIIQKGSRNDMGKHRLLCHVVFDMLVGHLDGKLNIGKGKAVSIVAGHGAAGERLAQGLEKLRYGALRLPEGVRPPR